MLNLNLSHVNGSVKAARVTEKMGGKMEDFSSLSTSCTNNFQCQMRIKKAISDIRKFSPEAEEIINRYLLPGSDKKHISGKKCVTMLEKIGCKACVCIFCYADKAQSWQEGARNKFQANGEYLKVLRDPEELPNLEPEKINSLCPFRFEAEGDLHNVDNARNYIRIANKPNHKHIAFALWTKNPEYIWKAIQRENGKPENLQLVLSSRYVNEPDIHMFERYNILCMAKYGYPLFDKLFTVWTEKGIENSAYTFNCCGSEGNKDRKCKNCMNCYKSEDYNIFVNEILR